MRLVVDVVCMVRESESVQLRLVVLEWMCMWACLCSLKSNTYADHEFESVCVFLEVKYVWRT